MNELHNHVWYTRFVTIDYVDFASGMECTCGKVLDQNEVENMVNRWKETVDGRAERTAKSIGDFLETMDLIDKT